MEKEKKMPGTNAPLLPGLDFPGDRCMFVNHFDKEN
jgi:hypothetical protein